MTAILALLGKVPLRWWLYAAGAAAVSFILWREHHAVHLAKKLATEKATVILELDQARATIDTMKVDAALNKETTNDLAKRLAGVLPARPLSVRCFTAVSGASAESGTTGRTDAAAERGGVEAPLRDVGAALEAVRVEQQTNNAKHLTLQKWEAARTH